MADENKTQGQKGKGRLFIILGILLILLGISGLFAYKTLFSEKENPIEKAKKEELKKIEEEIKKAEKPGIMYNLGSLIVNLADQDAVTFLKVSITLELDNLQVQEQVEQRLPQIKDAIISLISSRTSNEIKTPEGQEKLKEEILKRINAILPAGGVRNVYFTEFIIQSS
ncbi:MAG TPA: flagellar basal body-associated FliL family protein [Aquificae bacterium]|nr:flagellar basal body-associated FliL family protein [Aquificota bacterium]